MNYKKFPNFLIAGAAKGGTTSIYYYLRQHPEVFLSSIKEPCFFCYASNKPSYKVAKDTVFTLSEYENLFANSEKYIARGEATAIYLYMYETVINNIKKLIPKYDDIKIIIVLRNPADRAFSQYMMNVRDLRETLSFEEAIKEEGNRRRENWNTDFFYLDRGFYYNQVEAYLKSFKNVRIYLFEDLIRNPKSLMKDICNFLHIDDSFEFKLEDKYNVSGRPKHKFINRMIKSDSALKRLAVSVLPSNLKSIFFESIKNKIYAFNLEKETLNINTKQQLLHNYFKTDIEKLQKIIPNDISGWINSV